MVPGRDDPDDSPEVTITLPPRADSVPRARDWARGVLGAWHAEDVEWVLSQLLTEVVTNAVLHAGSEVVVVLRALAGRAALRCEVSDASSVRPRRRHHSPDATTGRGLVLLEHLADDWGIGTGLETGTGAGAGKTVWFEVSAEPGGRKTDRDPEALLELFAEEEPGVAPGAGGAVLSVAA
jgi:anti-sigma regulatory factor (Ser/Thr protein kinase)